MINLMTANIFRSTNVDLPLFPRHGVEHAHRTVIVLKDPENKRIIRRERGPTATTIRRDPAIGKPDRSCLGPGKKTCSQGTVRRQLKAVLAEENVFFRPDRLFFSLTCQR